MAFVIFWFFGRKRCALFFSSIWWGKEGVRIIRNCWSHMRNGRIWFLPKVVLWLFPGELRWPWRVFVPHLSPRLYGDVEWPYWNLPPRFYGAQRIAQWRRPSSVAFWTQNKNGAAFRSVFKDGQIQHLNFFLDFGWFDEFWMGLAVSIHGWAVLPEVSCLLFQRLGCDFWPLEPQHLRLSSAWKGAESKKSFQNHVKTHTDIYIYTVES